MREATGQAGLMNIMLFIIGIIIVLLAGSIAYSKAFRVKNRIIDAIENTAQAGFTTGLSFALCLMMAECKTKLYAEEEDTLNE